jgi:hypothetical protein
MTNGVDQKLVDDATKLAEEIAPAVEAMEAAEVKELMVGPEDFSDEQKRTEKQIIHVLSYYPGLSGVMLQMGLGPQVAALTWKPVLFSLMRRGIVAKDEVDVISPAGRYKTLYRYRLASTPRESLDIAASGALASYTPA